MSHLYEKCVDARLHTEACVRENFGFVGSDERANAAVENMQELDFRLKTLEPANWEKYVNRFDL